MEQYNTTLEGDIVADDSTEIQYLEHDFNLDDASFRAMLDQAIRAEQMIRAGRSVSYVSTTLGIEKKLVRDLARSINVAVDRNSATNKVKRKQTNKAQRKARKVNRARK